MTGDWRGLFLLVEGDDDEAFVEQVLRPRLEAAGFTVIIKQHRQEAWKKIHRFVNAAKRVPESRLFFLRDMDMIPCFTKLRDLVCEKVSAIERERVIGVVPEIEGWYVAGVPDSEQARFGLSAGVSADAVHKSEFERVRPAAFLTLAEYRHEMLKVYDPDVACARSSSYCYFYRRKLGLPMGT